MTKKVSAERKSVVDERSTAGGKWANAPESTTTPTYLQSKNFERTDNVVHFGLIKGEDETEGKTKVCKHCGKELSPCFDWWYHTETGKVECYPTIKAQPKVSAKPDSKEYNYVRGYKAGTLYLTDRIDAKIQELEGSLNASLACDYAEKTGALRVLRGLLENKEVKP
jgi:hypothetical protein